MEYSLISALSMFCVCKLNTLTIVEEDRSYDVVVMGMLPPVLVDI